MNSETKLPAKAGARKKGQGLKKDNEKGFTLIELMITVAIVAVLAAIALPSYRAYVLRANRAQAKVDIMQTAQALERQYTVDRNYTAAVAICGQTLPSPPPANGVAVYNMRTACTANAFTITGSPLGQQLAHDPCGALTINEKGAKTFATGTAAQCQW